MVQVASVCDLGHRKNLEIFEAEENSIGHNSIPGRFCGNFLDCV